MREGITSTQIEYAKVLDKNKIQMDIAAVHADVPEVIKAFEDLGCRVIVFPDRYSHTFKYCMKLYRSIKKEKYQVVHVHGSSAMLVLELFVARIAGVPCRIAHSRNTSCLNEKMDKMLRPIFHRMYTKALSCGSDAGDFLFEGHEYQVFHNGKDFEKFKYSLETRKKYRDTFGIEGKKVLGFVGNLIEQKNPFFLLDVFKEVCATEKNVHLVIMGDGELREKLVLYSQKLEIYENITFTGRISNVNEIIQACDIMLLPSIYEGLPNVVLEWQIAGLPSLISDKITQECKVTDMVHFLPIDQGTQIWVDKVNSIEVKDNREKASLYACKEMQKAGFEIHESTRRLEEIYLLQRYNNDKGE
jgi:glycosyltransferase involved in cell wall biosynthesis